jgi:RNA polymerase sigma-70 factor (ECF subfamily)
MRPPDAPTASPSDATLIRRTARNDVAAFESLYDRHCRTIHALAVRIAGSQLADDVCQDAFVSIWRSAGAFSDQTGDARSWMLSIARNRAIDQIRRRARVTERETPGDVLLEQQPSRNDTDSAALRRIEAVETRELLSALSPTQKEAVALAFLADLTHPEIASRLRLPLGTVKGRIGRGLAHMRDELVARRGDPLGQPA